MSKYRIEHIIIQNFKCIEKFEFDNFDLKELIVFDGPNGYGKTTVYEAIEIILTERPRKYREVRLDARYTFNDSPIHKNANNEVILELILNDGINRTSVKRKFPPSNRKKSNQNNISKIFNNSTLYLNNKEASYKDLEKILVFDNLYNLFSILNYVEQDENTFFLKKDPKERYNSFLQSLLGGDKERQDLDKIGTLKNKIIDKIEILKPRRDEVLEFIQDSDDFKETTSYKRIIDSKMFEWDKEIISISDVDAKNSYLLEVEKLINLIENKTKLKDIDLLLNLNKFSNQNFYHELVDYYWSITNYEILQKEYENKQSNKTVIINANEIIRNIEIKNYLYFKEEKIKKLIEEKFDLFFDVNILFQTIENITTLQQGLNIQDRILSNLKDRRQELVNFRDQHKNDINLKEGECPTCGFDWKTNEELLKQIDVTEIKIFNEYIKTNNDLEELKEKTSKDFFELINSTLLIQIEQLEEENKKLIEEEFYFLLREKLDYFKNKFKHFFELIQNKDLILEIINKKIIVNKDEVILRVVEIVKSLKPNFPEELDITTIMTDFELYFDKSITLLETITNQDLFDKKGYINWQFSVSINSELQKLNQKISKYKNSISEIDKVIKVYELKLKDYTNEIVNKISIPFHIYTGKILQNHSLGSGLIINFETSKSSQIYITPNHKDQEVAYLLSSGQLSATVISLMLVLNKVFNKSKLGVIFIDDPLQTLDEINAHSLVELLKYNFNDQQLMLSTHEDRYSKFIRYKYEKFGLNTMSVNMKDIL
jgi:DNA repair protein SbcC/Rad50